MPGSSFADTNVIVYFAQQEARKFDRAAAIMESGVVVSVQVLNEFARVAHGKFHRTWPEVNESLELIRELAEVRPLTLETHERGIFLAERHDFHVYDAMIVAAAFEANCQTLYSEDMQHGLVVEGRLRIVNPFA